jgi:hypothetical protein
MDDQNKSLPKMGVQDGFKPQINVISVLWDLRVCEFGGLNLLYIDVDDIDDIIIDTPF